jgi:hypothetical protein
VATPQAAQRRAIVVRPVRVASRLVPVLAAKAAVLVAPTAALAANHVAPAAAIAHPVAGLPMVVVRKAKAISRTAIKRMATRRTAMLRMAMLPTATRHTATRAHLLRVVHVRKARVAIVRKVRVGHRARAAIVRMVVAAGRKVTVALLADARRVAVAAVVVAIVRAIAEPRFNVALRRN